jgi:hypothetical protein
MSYFHTYYDGFYPDKTKHKLKINVFEDMWKFKNQCIADENVKLCSSYGSTFIDFSNNLA